MDSLSLQSLAHLTVVRLGCRPYHHLLPHRILDKYALRWDGVGPIYFYFDKVENKNDKQSKVRIGENVFSLDDAFIYAARGGNLGLTELCKQLGAASDTYKVINKAITAAAGGGHEAIIRL